MQQNKKQTEAGRAAAPILPHLDTEFKLRKSQSKAVAK